MHQQDAGLRRRRRSTARHRCHRYRTGGTDRHRAIAEIATGASGSETRIGGCRFRTNVNESIFTDQGPVPFLYVGDVPAGTRLAVRQNSAQTYFDACVIGIPYL